KIPEFVSRGEFGLASGKQPDGSYSRVWFAELLPPDEVAFDADVYLLTKTKAQALKAGGVRVSAVPGTVPGATPGAPTDDLFGETSHTRAGTAPAPTVGKTTLRIIGTIPPELWNRLGSKLIPKLKSGSALRLGLDATVDLDSDAAAALQM